MDWEAFAKRTRAISWLCGAKKAAEGKKEMNIKDKKLAGVLANKY